jgi:hypothetical protein
MRVLTRHGACAVTLVALVSASGCATVIKGTSQEISITTDPPGAACELKRDGEVFATVDPTPGAAKVSKSSREIGISCRKNGFVEATASLQSSLEGWTIGNIVLGGLIGIVIDLGTGAINKYETELFVKLQPEKFARNEQRDRFFDGWRAQVTQQLQRNQAEIRKTCAKDQCDALLAKAETEAQNSLKQIESMRGSALIARADSPATDSGPAKGLPPGSIEPGAAIPPLSGLRVGDRWKYRLSDRGRTVGVVHVEIAQAGANRVKERITREGYPAFAVERDIETQFAPTRFEPQIDLPGGYRLSEIAPYFPSGTELTPSQHWTDVAGEFSILGYGMKSFSSSARVVGREKVKVPAGEFVAWKIETNSPDATGNSVHCTFWYAPTSLRTIKMLLKVDSPVIAAQTNDTYELMAFERGK